MLPLLRRTLPIFVALLLAIGLLTATEFALRAADVGKPTTRFVLQNGVWRDNPAFALRFFPGPWVPDTTPTQVAATKDASILRVAVLGESAAYGYPDPAFGFPRVLEAMLERDYPDRAVEVVNATLSGVNSNVLRESIGDVLALEPDVVVLYIGNNEFIGPFGAGAQAVSMPSSLLVRAKVLASRLRLTQVINHLRGNAKPTGDESPMACRLIPSEDPVVAETHVRFEANLRAMLRQASRAGVPVVLCTVAVNNSQWAPFGDGSFQAPDASNLIQFKEVYEAGNAYWKENNPGAALFSWRAAEKWAGSMATIHYQIGAALNALGQTDDANAAFARALALDAMPMRVTPDMNARIAAMASDANGKIALADCAAALAASAKDHLNFYDHCHFTFEGNQEIAQCIRSAMAGILPPPAGAALTSPELAARLGWNPWHARENLRYVRGLADKKPYAGRWDDAAWRTELDRQIAALNADCADAPLAAARTQVEAMADSGIVDPWLPRNAAQLEDAMRSYGKASQRLEAMLQDWPHFSSAWMLLAKARATGGDLDGAVAAWREASALRPDRRDWKRGLAKALYDARDFPAARAEYRALAALEPGHGDTWWSIGQTFEGEKNFAAAIAAYREGLEHAPDHGGLHYYLAKALLHENQREEAKAIAAKGVQVAPDNKGLQQLNAELGV